MGVELPTVGSPSSLSVRMDSTEVNTGLVGKEEAESLRPYLERNLSLTIRLGRRHLAFIDVIPS